MTESNLRHTRRTNTAHLAQTSKKQTNLFTRKSINRLCTNLVWLSSSVADQSLTAGRLNIPSKTANQLRDISARLESVSAEIERCRYV